MFKEVGMDTFQNMHEVNRIEVIDGTGRAYVKYLDKDEKVRYNLQDDNKTLKVFIDSVTDWNANG